jgi:hypothetical protein
MPPENFHAAFSSDELERIFPSTRSREFFEALYGDADDAAFDIRLSLAGARDDHLSFQFLLEQRPGKCLACNLTHGLPTVFLRHPVINMGGIIDAVAARLGIAASRLQWELGATRNPRSDLHVIPLEILIDPDVPGVGSR